MPEKITIEKLAEMSQNEFAAIRQEMATKNDLRATEANILRAIEGIDMHLSSYVSRWSEDFAKLHDWVKEIDGRVKVLEKNK